MLFAGFTADYKSGDWICSLSSSVFSSFSLPSLLLSLRLVFKSTEIYLPPCNSIYFGYPCHIPSCPLHAA